MFQLQTQTPAAWLKVVLGSFDEFLADHTLCERKASAMGMSLVAKYPDKAKILDPLIAFAREELEHFHIMYRVLAERGITLPPDTRDAYVNGLRKHITSNPAELLLDRLVISGVVEARGCERLQMVTHALPEGDLKNTYWEVTRAEARHHALFFRLAEEYFPSERIQERANVFFTAEAKVIEAQPLRPTVH